MYLHLKNKITRLLWLPLAMCLLVLANCTKPDDPNLTVNDAVFSLRGTVDGLPLKLEAGEQGYYMFTEYGYNPIDSLYNFVGRLEQAGCTSNCDEKIEILIHDAQPSVSGQPVNIQAVFPVVDYKYANITEFKSKEYFLTFNVEDSGYVNPSYLWDFGGGITPDPTIRNPVVKFTDSSTRTVCLTITDKTTLCSKTICNRVKPFDVDMGDSLVPNFSYTLLKTVTMVNYSKADAFFWDLGNGRTSVAFEPEFEFDLPGTYTVNLSVTNNQAGTTRTLKKNIVFKDPAFSCLANFSYNNPKVNTTPSKLNSTIKIKYTDKNGDEYESDLGSQPLGNFFTLLAHNGYKPNEKGQKTHSLTIKFKCRVFNKKTGTFKDLDITDGKIAVAYP